MYLLFDLFCKCGEIKNPRKMSHDFTVVETRKHRYCRKTSQINLGFDKTNIGNDGYCNKIVVSPSNQCTKKTFVSHKRTCFIFVKECSFSWNIAAFNVNSLSMCVMTQFLSWIIVFVVKTSLYTLVFSLSRLSNGILGHSTKGLHYSIYTEQVL